MNVGTKTADKIVQHIKEGGRENKVPTLTTRDRCDSSAAEQASVVVSKPGIGQLFLCSHHFNEHEPRLIVEGWSISDQRETLFKSA